MQESSSMADKAFNMHQQAGQADDSPDYYELLQISPNAEPETIHRVYRLLAQRLHPDNQQSGDPGRFRTLVEAYAVLSDPEKRAAYDLTYNELRHRRFHASAAPERAQSPMEVEQVVRVTVLEVLYEQRRTDPARPGVFILDLEELTGQPREHLEFTVWYLVKKNFVSREDNSKLAITADGVDYLENQYLQHVMRKRLEAHSAPV
jgi:curved DNA-binding protein CbpA